MTKHDQDTEMFQQHVLQLCHHMSGVYLKIVFDQVELALVSSHRAENIVAVNILHGLRALPAGSALKVLKDVREQLLPPIVGHSITITGIRSIGIGSFAKKLNTAAAQIQSISGVAHV